MKKHLSRRTLSCIALASTLLLGCAGESTDSLIASAKAYLDKNDKPAAVIQLKNALQKDPESGEARFLLGTTLLETGNAPAASIELRKALAAKHPQEVVLPPLARALLREGQAKKVTDDYASTRLTQPAGAADLSTTLALAYAAQGRESEARQALAAALQAVPDYPAARVVEARFKLAERDFTGAMTLLDAAIAKAPLDHDAWQLRGDVLLYGESKPLEALAAYRKSVALKQDSVQAHKGILTILMASEDVDAIKAPLDDMKKALPRHPQTRYFEAQYAVRQRDFKAAKEHIDQVLRVAPDSVEALQLAGAIEAQTGALLQAEKHLARAVSLAPESTVARRLLTETYVRSGQAAKALEIAQPLADKGSPDANTLALVAQAHLLNGNAKQAEELFAQAAKLDPSHVRSRVALALAQVGKGEVKKGVAELKAAAQADASGFADLALISVHLRRSEWKPALEAIGALERKQPDKPLPLNLRGGVQLALKDEAGARKSFEQALVIDPAYFPAVARLAALDINAKQPDAARKRFERVLAADPKHVQALLGLAALEARAGGSAEAVSGKIANAVELNPGEAAPRLLLIEQHLRTKDAKAALTAAQDAVSALPNNADLLDALGRAQTASGQANQAIATFTRLATLEPKSARPHLRLAELHTAEKNSDAAIQSLKRALAVSPGLLAAQGGLMVLHAQAKRPKEALAIAREVQKQRPDEAVGFALEGDLEASQKNWDAALAAYRTALKAPGSDELAPKLHATLIAARKTDAADSFATTWIKEHPKDVRFHFYLGELASRGGDSVRAETHYRAVLAQQPENAAALNNLAWVTNKLGKPGALALAEKASALRPGEPNLMDTMATILASENQVAKAVELQKKVVELQPNNPVFRLNLAKIYIKAGDKALARSELETLAKAQTKFGGQAEVAELLKTL